MDGIAAEIAIEIRVLLQYHDVDSGASKEKARHHSRRSTTDNEAATACFRNRIHGLPVLRLSNLRCLNSEANDGCLEEKKDGIELVVAFRR